MIHKILSKLPFFKNRRRYPYFIGGSKDILRVHITKTAGTSLQRALRFNPPNKNLGIKKHYFVRQIIELEGRDVWDNAFTFTFIRNPWDRMYSQYRFEKRKEKPQAIDRTFEEWLKFIVVEKEKKPYRHWRSQMEWLIDDRGEIDLNFIGRFENINEDMQTLAKKINRKIKLPKVNMAAPIRHYSDAYTDELRDIVAAHYADDIEEFGYNFDRPS